MQKDCTVKISHGGLTLKNVNKCSSFQPVHRRIIRVRLLSVAVGLGEIPFQDVYAVMTKQAGKAENIAAVS